ncbi:MAG: DUF1512 family protein [Candidatus Aenigmarchaeota archaeon]|nr:DUF1512 family protein [Candidatus Aenigmarchaeota archaeon]
MQFMQATDPVGIITWFAMLFIFMYIYPRMMLSQLISKIDQSARKIEGMSEKANGLVLKKTGTHATKHAIHEFTELFVVEPSSIDPFGLVKKIDQTIKNMEQRFSQFAQSIAKNKEEVQEINYGLRAAVSLRQMAKIVRHYVEISKKFKNLQIAMILQMQLPIIEKIAESELKGTEAFVNGWPIGDSIGPLVAATYMKKPKNIAEEVVVDETVINGRVCFVLKATGPAPHLGRIDEAILKIMKSKKISRVVTIDAGAKLEGEKTGSVAEGVGFAMGGVGQREMIENVLLPKGIPIDSIVIKVGIDEAILPMKKSIFESVDKVKTYVDRAVDRASKGQKVIIIGVGNSCGVKDDYKAHGEVKEIVEELHKQYKKEEKEAKKGGWI